MKKFSLLFFTGAMLMLLSSGVSAQQNKGLFPPDYQVDTRIDNMGYWRRCAEAGLVTVQPNVPAPPAKFTGSKLLVRGGVRVADSPDVPTTNEPSNSTQSENSIVINPNNELVILNSNNSTPYPSTGSVKGADALKSLDAGETWSGTVEGAGGPNSGDPAAVIDLNGRWFVGFIDNASGQTVAYSDDQGATWTSSKVANGTLFNLLDKNHLWVDISPASPYKGHLYNGWMSSEQIMVSRSVTSGASWSTPVNISAATAAGSHNQGINFKCGPDGEVYAVWGVYDNWPGDEKAIGFNKSLNGGETWGTAVRAINNLKGIRTVGVSQNMRVNSFPVMAVDLSNSPHRGTIYVVWTNTGVPGVNLGPGSSVYMIKSTDKGETWSAPKRVNSDSTSGKHHYLPWIACDQATGYLSIVFYDNRNCASTEAEAWMAYSTDGGETFTDMKVSDVTFTPQPIPNMASKYMGDYLAIDAYGGKCYPCWTDTRSGHCLTYISPIELILPSAIIASTAQTLNDQTFGNGNGVMDYGETELLGLTMKNTGNADASAVTVYLSCDNPYITVTDSTEVYGDFLVDETKYIPDGFKFSVNDSIANGEQVMFTVRAVDANDTVTYSTFLMQAYAPDVSILSMQVDDAAPGGNGNGRLDPGESVNILITHKNNGIWNAENVVSHLASLNSYVTITGPDFPIGTLAAGQTVTASFPATINGSAAIGSVARLLCTATSKYRTTDKLFNAKIGLIVEDWETGNFSKFEWQFTNTDKPWTIDPVVRQEGNYSARSGVITDNEASGIFIQYNASVSDSISFYRRTSCQGVKDILKFFIDDAVVGIWSGFTDTTFRRYAYAVTAGPHTFKWVYEKNATVTQGSDAAWVDFIVFPPRYYTTANAGVDASVCAGSIFQCHGMADSYDSLRWTTTGTGTFSDPTALDPTYTPSTQDIAAGTVQLTLTAYGQNSSMSSGSLTLSIAQPPAANAGGSAAVCSGTSFMPGATASNQTSVHWITRGDGTFSNAGILLPVYTPGPGDLAAGSARLVLFATGSSACPEATDSLTLSIHPLPQVALGPDTLLCAGASVTLNATSPGAASYLWLPSNQTTPAITVDSTGIGLHNRMITAIVTDQNGCAGRDSVNVGFKVCGAVGEIPGVEIRLYPNPNDGAFALSVRSAHPEVLNLAVLDENGRRLFSRNGVKVHGTVTEQVDAGKLPRGAYLLEVSGKSGKTLIRFVVGH